MKNGFLAFLFVILVSGISWADEPIKLPPAFRADQVTLYKGQEKASGFVASDGQGNIHNELGSDANRKMVGIFNYNKKKAWTVMSPGKYIETDMDLDKIMKTVPKDVKKDCGPGEVLEGHPTKKCVYTTQMMGKPTTTTVWLATDLNELALKSMNPEGSGMMLKNIKLGSQPADLFEEPKGQKMSNEQAGTEMVVGDLKAKGNKSDEKLLEYLQQMQKNKKP
ncbi:MAG: hypothetical protein HY073_04045 [Deltaproteobacteria bacterium]|nr:hypothetical protein [Deltaproteobacteria bacterium]